MTTKSVDHYLKTIFLVVQESGRATTGEIAERLGLTAGSVTGMIRKLAEHEPPLVVYTKSKGVTLTESGRLRALEMIRHHRLIELFLHESLGLPWDKVHDEAERLEHHISEELEERIAEFLGDPETDPHGSPIPRRDGTLPERPVSNLLKLNAGDSGEIARVSSQTPEVLRYLESLGIVPGARVTVAEIAPFGGPVHVRVGDKIHALGRKPAVCVFVRVQSAGGATPSPGLL